MKNMAEKFKIKTFMDNDIKLTFGDFILFQEYEQSTYDGEQYSYSVTKPIFGIFLGSFVADQALGFNYVRWINDNRVVYITNENVTNCPVCKEVDKIEHHIEWSDYIDILGSWSYIPNWKEIIACYRNQNLND